MLWISNRDVALMSPESRNVSLKSELRRLSRRRRKSGHWLNPRHMTYERHVVNEHLDDRFRLVVSFQSGFLGGWRGAAKIGFVYLFILLLSVPSGSWQSWRSEHCVMMAVRNSNLTFGRSARLVK